jgi:hypothetical protein
MTWGSAFGRIGASSRDPGARATGAHASGGVERPVSTDRAISALRTRGGPPPRRVERQRQEGNGRSDAVRLLYGGNSSKGVNRVAGIAPDRPRTPSGGQGGSEACNASNPTTGSGMQQARGRRAEQAVEVARNHEDGTSRNGWCRRPGGFGLPSGRANGTSVKGRKADESQRRRGPGLLAGCDGSQLPPGRSEQEAKDRWRDVDGSPSTATRTEHPHGGRTGNGPTSQGRRREDPRPATERVAELRCTPTG